MAPAAVRHVCPGDNPASGGILLQPENQEWQFNFRHFLSQPLLLKKYLGKYEEEIRAQTRLK
ncbi:MAG: hypothetical protein P8Y63_12335 [Deltaproteobacteria bacterium]|jgi:hypothetical protein